MQLPHASDEEGVSDVRLTRDQRRAHGQPSSASAGKGKATPSASMRSESLFATVSLSMGGSMGGNRSRAGAPAASLLHSGARANSKMQLGSTRGRDQAAGDLAMQEEMFDHAGNSCFVCYLISLALLEVHAILHCSAVQRRGAGRFKVCHFNPPAMLQLAV